ncbi:arginine-tRNA-protein transferase [Natronocella acetinitrilica]|uniref:Aspartate/glutamate leucyltransferase n=1 Tax=Natronocella acetinitrilica TaxID=414046 RepID=A0AAE3G967_9GAMM|nr:arginyltransferase [Natronocella acetinitrilica]MCP1676107.1 arginine-tRNA-protein transferase [Natronocella acetinitrilica]
MKSDQRNPGSGTLWLYSTGEHACSYLEDRSARTVFVDPAFPVSNAHYSRLITQGMRRSGHFIYQPGCAGCSSCKSLRIPVADFCANRAQRRCWNRNQDIRIIQRPPVFVQQHFALYRHYMSHRHPGSGMDEHDPERYMEFLVSNWSDTVFLEMRRGQDLLGVAVTDRLADGLSAVYTFFHPELARRSLGTFGILAQIEHARMNGLAYVYLGYWIAESPKMRYKATFRPHEIHTGGRWLRTP